jgi:hypothetical protein
MNHENAEKWRVSRSQDKMFLCTAGRPKFVPYSALMRPLFAILSLLLSLIATRADDLPVIKDSEAAQYIGKKRRSSRFGRLRHDSPLGTAFINFGQEDPKQTFAGFIAPVQTWRLTSRSPRSKGKSSASPAQSSCTKGSRRSKSHRRVRSKGRILSRRGDEILSRKANDGLLSQVPTIPHRLRCNLKGATGLSNLTHAIREHRRRLWISLLARSSSICLYAPSLCRL